MRPSPLPLVTKLALRVVLSLMSTKMSRGYICLGTKDGGSEKTWCRQTTRFKLNVLQPTLPKVWLMVSHMGKEVQWSNSWSSWWAGKLSAQVSNFTSADTNGLTLHCLTSSARCKKATINRILKIHWICCSGLRIGSRLKGLIKLMQSTLIIKAK